MISMKAPNKNSRNPIFLNESNVYWPDNQIVMVKKTNICKNLSFKKKLFDIPAEKNHVGGANIIIATKRKIKKLTVFHILLNLK
tara:strand:+ start:599 stop:850 length:252 start_codon:yes stop_codon:yes gene_type:complete